MPLSNQAVTVVVPKQSASQLADTPNAVNNGIYEKPKNFDTLISEAKSSNAPTGATYKLALDIANNNFADNQEVDQRTFKDTVDKIYNDMWKNEGGPQVSADQLRGENAFTKIVEGAKDTINGINGTIGNVLDGVFDNTIANIIDWANEESIKNGTGTSAKDFFTGEDLAVVPDIIEDIGLSLLGPAGWGAVAAKNLVQNSTNLYEGITGKDSITLDDLSDAQRAAKVGSGLVNTALASLPGIGGAARGLSKAIKGQTAAGKVINDITKTNAPKLLDAPKVSDDIAEIAEESVKLLDAPKASSSEATNVTEKAISDALTGELPVFETKEAAKEFADAVRKINKEERIKKTADSNYGEKATKEIIEEAKADPNYVEKATKDLLKDDLKRSQEILKNDPNVYVEGQTLTESIINNIADIAKSDKEFVQKNIIDRFHIPTRGSKARRAEAKKLKEEAKAANKDKTISDKAKDTGIALAGTAGDTLKALGRNFVAPMGLTAANLGLNEMATTGNEDFFDAVANSIKNTRNDKSVPMAMFAPLLVGTGKVGKLNRNIKTGLPQTWNPKGHQTIGDNLGYIGQRASSLGLLNQDYSYGDYLNPEKYSDEVLENRMKSLKARL